MSDPEEHFASMFEASLQAICPIYFTPLPSTSHLPWSMPFEQVATS